MDAILFVDEEYWFVEPIIEKVKLEFPDHEVFYCEDGMDAISLVMRNHHITHVVLDLQLPLFDEGLQKEFDDARHFPRNLTGLMVLDKIKKIRREIKVLCLTIVADYDVPRMIQDAGAKYLSKNELGAIPEIIAFIKTSK